MKNIRKRVFGGLVTSLVCMITVMPMTAFAQSKENSEQQEAEATYGPLTPDGNMSLVDDYGSIEVGGKQFITVVTKSGNYFYIIIDRDDQGEETVHFLNMVDESDLLKLMDENEVKEYTESMEGQEVPVPTATTSSQPEEASEPTEMEKSEVATQKKSSTGILVIVLLVTVGGIGGYVFLKGSKKKTPKNAGPGPDPDADYIDEEEDYLAELAEDETKEMEKEEEE